MPHGPEIPIPNPPQTFEFDDSDDESMDNPYDQTYEDPNTSSNEPIPLSQSQLNDLTRDLGLSKLAAELLGSRLRENNLLDQDTTFYWYRKREEEFRPFFEKHRTSSSLVYCSNIKGLIEFLGLVYIASEWRLFIDSSKRSLKAVLLNIGNKVSSVPVAHSVQLTESYEAMKILLDAIGYDQHNWMVCGDLKVGIFNNYPILMN